MTSTCTELGAVFYDNTNGHGLVLPPFRRVRAVPGAFLC